MKAIDRIYEYLEYKGIKPTRLEKEIGVSNGYLGTQRKRSADLGEGIILKIIDYCRDINLTWLLTGRGQMIYDSLSGIPTENQEYVDIVPVLPVSAQGGSFNDFVASVKAGDCERIASPIKGVDFVIRVSGDSMSPEYPNGSMVFIKRINERAFIEWGKVYVLDTCNGTVIKKIEPGTNDDELVCVSINPAFKPFKVCLKEDIIYGIYRVLLCMSMK